MNSYFMFVIAVTVVYAIYYAVMIMKDMQVKKEDQSQNGEEFSIDIEDAPEESISVSENADGFSVGENSYETEVDKASDGVQEQSKKESNKQSRLDQLKVIQECISLGVFAVIANILFQGQTIHWNHVLAFLLIICAVYLVFMK